MVCSIAVLAIAVAVSSVAVSGIVVYGIDLAWSIAVALAQSPPTPSAPVASHPLHQVIEVAKLLVLAVPGYLAARLQAKKEERAGQVTRDESLVAGWQSMSMQAREQLTMAYADTAREREARHVAEKRVEELERELAELRRSVRPQ